jgi:Domain of unknown function (DUF4288)
MPEDRVEEAWFAASLVLAIINEFGGLWRRVTSVVLVRAANFEQAFIDACMAGRAMESTYTNADGERVRWAFERVETLDELPANLASGTEVYSLPHKVGDASELTFDATFAPELHPPGQSGV